MEELLRETLLFDFYGELLTEKQKTIFELFHLQDLSLSEIGEEQGISRQAVRDQLKRTEAILQAFSISSCVASGFAIRRLSSMLSSKR